MSSAGINPLAIIAPDLYSKQLAIQQRQALAQALLQNGSEPGKGGYGGLRSAGNSILGAILSKRANSDMAGLYASQQESQPTWGQPGQSQRSQTPETQISNNPGTGPVMAPQTPSQPSAATPQPSPAQAMGQALQAPQGQAMPPPQPMGQQARAGQPISPQMQQILQQRYGSSEPQQWQAQPQSQRTIPGIMGQAIPDLPGVSHEASMLAYFQSPQAYFTALAAGNAPTPDMKNAMAANPGNPVGQRQALTGIVGKAGSIEVRPEGFVVGPDGKITYGPNESSNVYYTTGPNNEPIAHMIPQGAEAAASTAGQIEAAKEQNRVIEVTLSDGRVVPMRAGDVVPYGTKTPITPPQQQTQGAPNSGARTLAAQNPSLAAQVNATRPPPITVGQSTAQKEVNEATGTSAAGYAKAQAATGATLKAIDGLIAINDQVPDSTGMSPEWKADINKRIPFAFKNDAGGLAQWNQLNGIGVLGGLKTLQGLGRLDLPEVNQVVKTNGVPSDIPRAQRLQILQNLRTMVQNNLAAAQGNVANLNQPGITGSTQTTPMQNYGSASAQDIVDELRRRGKVK